jgi:hypothetical protein
MLGDVRDLQETAQETDFGNDHLSTGQAALILGVKTTGDVLESS